VEQLPACYTPQALGLQQSLHQYAARCLSCHRQIWNRLGRNTWQHQKEQQNFSTETTETSPSQFGVSSATVSVLLILHLAALEPGIKSKHWQYPLPKRTNSNIQTPNSIHLPNALMSARRQIVCTAQEAKNEAIISPTFRRKMACKTFLPC
jgi:hypothetical protein